jgi:hypothetical protein
VVDGVEVDGARYSLTEHDQIELMAQKAALLTGAASVPYHADGQLCRAYAADEFLAVAAAAEAHIFYHRSLCNHLNVWVRRLDGAAEVRAVTYGGALPEDLAASLAALLGSGGAA